MGKVRRTTPGQLYGNSKKLNRARAKQLRNNIEENEQNFFSPQEIQRRQEHTRQLWQLCTNKNLDELRMECWKVRNELSKLVKDSDLLSIEVEDSLERVQKEHSIFQKQLDKGAHDMKEANSNWKNMKNSHKNLESDIVKVNQRLDKVIQDQHEIRVQCHHHHHHQQQQQQQQQQKQSSNDATPSQVTIITSSQDGPSTKSTTQTNISKLMNPKNYQQFFEDVQVKVDKELSSFHNEFKSLFKENKEVCDKMERKLAMISEACLEQVNGAARQANYAFQETHSLKIHMNEILGQFQACMEQNQHFQNQLTSLQTQVNANRMDPRLEQKFHDLETDFFHTRSDFYAYRKLNDDLQIQNKEFIIQKTKEVTKELYQAISSDSRHHIRENKKLQQRIDQLTGQTYHIDNRINHSRKDSCNTSIMKRKRIIQDRREPENDNHNRTFHQHFQDDPDCDGTVSEFFSSSPRSSRHGLYSEASKRRRHFHLRNNRSRSRSRNRSRSRSESRSVQPQEGERDRNAVGSLLFGDFSEKTRHPHRMQLNALDFDLCDQQRSESCPSVSEENSGEEEEEDQFPPAAIVIDDIEEREQQRMANSSRKKSSASISISTAAENQKEKSNQIMSKQKVTNKKNLNGAKIELKNLDICLEDVRLSGLLYFCYGGAVNLETTWMSYFTPLDQEDCVAMSDILQLQRRFPALHRLPVYFSQFLVQACIFESSNTNRQENEQLEKRKSELKNLDDAEEIYHSLLEEIYFGWMQEIPQHLMKVYETFGGNPSGITFERIQKDDINPHASKKVKDSFKKMLELKLDMSQETMLLLKECPLSVYLFVTLFDSTQVHRMCPQKGTYRLNRIGSDLLASLWEILLSKLPYALFMDISWLDRQSETKGHMPVLGFCHLIAVLLLEYGSIFQGHLKNKRDSIAEIVQLLFDCLQVNGKQAKNLQDPNLLLQDQKEIIEFVEMDSKLISLLAMDSFFEITASLCGGSN